MRALEAEAKASQSESSQSLTIAAMGVGLSRGSSSVSKEYARKRMRPFALKLFNGDLDFGCFGLGGISNHHTRQSMCTERTLLENTRWREACYERSEICSTLNPKLYNSKPRLVDFGHRILPRPGLSTTSQLTSAWHSRISWS